MASDAQNIDTQTASTGQFVIPWMGLSTALAWAISPIFIRAGLDELDAPLWGVSIGLFTNVIIYGLMLWLRRREWGDQPIPAIAIRWQLGAAVFVALATWARWVALDLEKVAIVTALERLSVPMVIVLSVLLLDQSHERVNWRVWLGGMMILAGAVILSVTK
jgi:uncharacterized membrane protein